jgi:GNAT superfamily N-acetyltransferase
MIESPNIEERRLPISYRVVRYSPEDAPLVVALQRHLWTSDLRLNAEYLEWKYHQNPYIREPLLYLAFAGDRLVGMRGAFGTRWESGEPRETVTLPYPDDLVVDPAFRGRGLHGRIMSFALEDLHRRGYRYVVNLSASKVTRLMSMRMRWRDAGGTRHVQRSAPRRTAMGFLAEGASKLPLAWRWSKSLRRLGGYHGDRLFDRFDSRSAKGTRRRPTDAVFAQTTPLPEQMESLINRLPRTGRIRHVRDQSYFGWRFRNPLRSYRFLYAGGDRVEGYLVLQRSLSEHEHTNRVSIVDWEAEREPVLEALLNAAIDYGRFPVLSAWRPGVESATGQLLDRYGFTSAEGSQSILVRSVSSADLAEPWAIADHALDDADQWDLRMIYSMVG